jgi:hypothetical protein
MKSVFLIVSLIVSTIVSAGIEIPETCTPQEKVLIKELIKNQKQPLVEIMKGSNTHDKLVIHFERKMYIYNNLHLEKLYVLGDGDWVELQYPNRDLSSEHRLPAFVLHFYTYEDEPFIEIIPLNGTNSWTLYYQEFFFDPTINATIYFNDDALVGIGEDYVFYEDDYDIFMFATDNCQEDFK